MSFDSEGVFYMGEDPTLTHGKGFAITGEGTAQYPAPWEAPLTMKTRNLFLLCASLLPALAAGAAPAVKPGKWSALPLPVQWDSALSPDGRWLAGFERRGKNRVRVAFYGLKNGWRWSVAAGEREPDSMGGAFLEWRPDSRACAVAGYDGYQLVWPREGRNARLPLPDAAWVSRMVWAPQGERLALFNDSRYWLWNGHKLGRGVRWAEAIGFPERDEPQVWDAVWSPDARGIALRFYGHSIRDSTAAGHLTVIQPRTARPRFNWGAEARTPQWLDASRLMFQGNDNGFETNSALVAAQPSSRSRNVWLEDAAAWTLSPDRQTVWAITTKGDLCRTPSRRKAWQVVRRRAVSPRVFESMQRLKLAPRGDMIALTPAYPGSGITLLSTSKRRPWTMLWCAPRGSVRLLGWAEGQSLPLLQWNQMEEGPAKLIQMRN